MRQGLVYRRPESTFQDEPTTIPTLPRHGGGVMTSVLILVYFCIEPESELPSRDEDGLARPVGRPEPQPSLPL